MQFIPALHLSWKTVKPASSISENYPFLGEVNFFRNLAHSLIAAFSFHHSQMMFSSTPKIAAGFVLSFLLCAPNKFMFELCCI
jgi:hypothetical protein